MEAGELSFDFISVSRLTMPQVVKLSRNISSATRVSQMTRHLPLNWTELFVRVLRRETLLSQRVCFPSIRINPFLTNIGPSGPVKLAHKEATKKASPPKDTAAKVHWSLDLISESTNAACRRRPSPRLRQRRKLPQLPLPKRQLPSQLLLRKPLLRRLLLQSQKPQPTVHPNGRLLHLHLYVNDVLSVYPLIFNTGTSCGW